MAAKKHNSPNPSVVKRRAAFPRQRPFLELLDGVTETDLFLNNAEIGIKLQLDTLHRLCPEMPAEADGKLLFLVSSVQREVQEARARLDALTDEINALKQVLAPDSAAIPLPMPTSPEQLGSDYPAWELAIAEEIAAAKPEDLVTDVHARAMARVVAMLGRRRERAGANQGVAA